MQIAVVETEPTLYQTPALVLPMSEGGSISTGPARVLDEALDGAIGRVVSGGDFVGREGQTSVLYPRPGELPTERVILVGLGKLENVSPEQLRRSAATAVKLGSQLELQRLSILVDAVQGIPDVELSRALVEGGVLGGYVFDELKSVKPIETRARGLQHFDLLTAAGSGVAGELRSGASVGEAIARATNLARRLGNLPGNIATPAYLAQEAKSVAAKHGMSATVLGRSELEREGLHALLAVARGSEQEPYLIILEHRRAPTSGRPLVLVGKGVTFDSGGISIKPAPGMEEMKFDMCGAAAVIGAMDAIGSLDIAADVVAVLPVVENLPSGSALKPGDIIPSHFGKTIEVVNTDAEGRLILADALSYARRFEPAAIVDAATLTGACVIALGNHATGAFTNDDSLLTEVRAAGDRTNERVWPLPLYEEYGEQLKSDYADLKNSGGRPGGAITAARFLREFVGDTPWVHLDIAGTAAGEGKLAYQSKGATGVPTRLFVEWIRSRAV